LKQIDVTASPRTGGREAVQVKRLISKRIRQSARGFDLAADVNADVSVNVAERRPDRERPTGTDRPTPRSGPGAGRDERGKETR
jgi:hypothetical protein